MRGSISTVIVFLISLLVVLLYQFLGKPRLAQQVESVRAENLQLEGRLATIQQMELATPGLIAQLPEWRSRLEMYLTAIPADLNDDLFLAALNEQLIAQGVDLLNVSLTKGGPWLGELGETQIAELTAAGIDPDAARSVHVAFYSITLRGDFGGVLRAFENLKQYNRLYSIDQVTGPVSAGGGMISAELDPGQMPIEITGRIYYGIPKNYLSMETLVDVFNNSVIIPMSRSVQSKIVDRGHQLLTGATTGAAADNGAPAAQDGAKTATP